MKPRLSQKPIAALTKVDVMVIIAVLAVLTALLLPALALAKRRASYISCANDLKQVGIAFRLWEGDNNGKYPMAVSVTNGGAMELVATGNVAACFRVMSNEVNIAIILHCPEDSQRIPATNWAGLTAKNISYFVGVDVASDAYPNRFLCGDDNFAMGSVPAKAGVLEISEHSPVTWTSGRHCASYKTHFWTTPRKEYFGYVGFADGSLQQLNNHQLQPALRQTGIATNRLAIP